ncbi:polycystin-1-like [Sphaerodactylus townsendi]|uniref:polycystin-1-like n=1 Tax=Sphaerodactylus townsendi TaxID=933632 RepID=UPI0020263CFF|nr:polycystin-1-like [Sphaerodactylus townsendi]
MGDGCIYINLSRGIVSHTFAAEGEYMVTVTAHSAAASNSVSTIVEVYKLQIISILADSCLSTGEPSLFQAVVTGPVKQVQFCWDFQDGSPPSIKHGNVTVLHCYMAAGKYQLNLTAHGTVSTVSHQLTICVEDKIRSVQLLAPMPAVALGEPLSFLAEVDPVPDPMHQYKYHWDFGIDEDPVLSRTPEITFVYLETGVYMVTVTVWNMVSRQNASVSVVVQRAVSTISIHSSGETGMFLAIGIAYLFEAEINWDATATFKWDFGDASPQQVGQRASHTYQKAGDVTIVVVGENLISHKTATLAMVVLTLVKNLTLYVEHPVGESGQEVTFRASLAAGDHVRYYWAVGEASELQEGIATFSYIFSTAGIFVVFAMVENAVSMEKANITIEVQDTIQGVVIHSEHVVQNKYVAVAEPFSLFSEVTHGSNVTSQWTVSQGKQQLFTAEEQLLSFFPNTTGNLLVEVRVGNALGEFTSSLTLEVLERVSGVKIHSTTDRVAVGKPVNLSISVTSGIDLLYLWRMEKDAQPLFTTFSSLSYTYTTLGSKLVFVTVSNALGSSNGSRELRVQEPVFGANFSLIGATRPFSLKSGAIAQLLGMVATGSDIAWEWQLWREGEEKLTFHEQNISCEFEQFGDYKVFLRVWNDISESTIMDTVSVHEPVAGLAVTVDKQNVCTNEEVTFLLHVLQGTSMAFALCIPSLDIYVENQRGVFCLSFPVPGHHQVFVSAYNSISNQTVAILVTVLEKVKGLHLLSDCPSVLESNKELTFKATVQSGESITFSWAFQLDGLPDYNATGQQVTYIPSDEGNLTILIEASNSFCADTLTIMRTLEAPVKAVTLSCNGTRAFVNQTVSFDVIVVGGSNLHTEWKFGDSVKSLADYRDGRVFHKYNHAGDYLVEVRVYNQISFVLAQTKITVQELGCKNPTVKLVDPPSVISRSYHSYFEADVDLKNCIAYRALYQWEIFHSSTCDHLSSTNLVSLPYIDRLTPRLVLPALSLDVGPYCLRFTVSLENTPLFQVVSSNFTVVSSKLVPVIQGGSWRSWTAKLDLVLDGSKSYDPDIEMRRDSSLEYQWSCELEVIEVEKSTITHIIFIVKGVGYWDV